MFERKNILEAMPNISLYKKTYNFESFCQNDKTIDTVVRNFEIIDEAANLIYLDYRIQHSQIAWLRGLRNRVIHKYFGVDLEIFWAISTADATVLISDSNKIINDLNSSQEQ